MAKNKTTDQDKTLDELADQLVDRAAAYLVRQHGDPDHEQAKIEVSRLLRDSLPALWEWCSQENEIERLKSQLEKSRERVKELEGIQSSLEVQRNSWEATARRLASESGMENSDYLEADDD